MVRRIGFPLKGPGFNFCYLQNYLKRIRLSKKGNERPPMGKCQRTLKKKMEGKIIILTLLLQGGAVAKWSKALL